MGHLPEDGEVRVRQLQELAGRDEAEGRLHGRKEEEGQGPADDPSDEAHEDLRGERAEAAPFLDEMDDEDDGRVRRRDEQEAGPERRRPLALPEVSDAVDGGQPADQAEQS